MGYFTGQLRLLQLGDDESSGNGSMGGDEVWDRFDLEDQPQPGMETVSPKIWRCRDNNPVV